MEDSFKGFVFGVIVTVAVLLGPLGLRTQHQQRVAAVFADVAYWSVDKKGNVSFHYNTQAKELEK